MLRKLGNFGNLVDEREQRGKNEPIASNWHSRA
jgi:hypothetical protein